MVKQTDAQDWLHSFARGVAAAADLLQRLAAALDDVRLEFDPARALPELCCADLVDPEPEVLT